MNKLRSNRLKISLSLLALFIWLLLPLAADEGMWPYNLVPKDYLAKKYNFKVTDEWLNHLRLASVRFGGASASFVSPDGLVLTNHHVGRGAIQNLSTAERDLIKNGFYARTRDQELKCPGVELWILQGIEDVT
jgi:Peptidase S46.